MTAITQRRSSVAILVLTALVLSVDTANAVQRRTHDPAHVTRAEAHSAPVAQAHLVAAHVTRKRTAHKPPRRGAPRAVVAPKPRSHRATRHPSVRTKHPRRIARITGPTGWAALDAAIGRIPTYRPAGAIWLVSNRYGYWGTADWYHDTIYIAPGVPTNRVYDVAVHEWSHELSVLDYDGDVEAAVAAMNSAFGGTGLVGAERAADCMARLQGAQWTHYTPCLDGSWRAAAARLVAGHRL